MKKIITFAFVFAIFSLGFFSTAPKTAFAADIYGRAETSNVGFYSSELDDEPMFYLPIGYYVTITGESDDFYSCEYAKTESSYTKKYGFVKKSEIYIDEEMALPMFPEITLTAIKDTNLYTKQNMSNIVSSITAGQKAYFYGLYEGDGVALYYVKISGDFGYVETSGFEQLAIPTHPKLLSTEETLQSVESAIVLDESTDEVIAESTSALAADESINLTRDIQLAMILCIAIPALIFMFYAFRPNTDTSSRYFEN